ncbi:MAG: hypothetical protein KF841_06545 [Phycisphaerae bacterium]|nr:hypothetical protein [Phycisphaerae bacterium]
MKQIQLASRFTYHFAAGLWRFFVLPLLITARERLSSIVPAVAGCSFRGAGAVMCATVLLASASQVLAPAANPKPIGMKAVAASAVTLRSVDRAKHYAWLSKSQVADFVPLSEYIAVPPGFSRVKSCEGGFASWLRHLPIAPIGTPVTTSNGKVVYPAEDGRIAVTLALQPRSGRLLAGANMMIRLRAEYEWSMTERGASLGFHLTSGHFVAWRPWAAGIRPVIDGRNVTFTGSGQVDDTRANFCAYLETLFQYTSSLSLLDDSRPLDEPILAAGDMFLPPSRCSQPLMVLDIATDREGAVCVLLGRGGVPAQTFHVLRGADGSPWFPVMQGGSISVEGQTYDMSQLRRWAR